MDTNFNNSRPAFRNPESRGTGHGLQKPTGAIINVCRESGIHSVKPLAITQETTMNKACHDEPKIHSDSAGPGNPPTATGPHRRHAVSRRSLTAWLVGLTLTETRRLSAQERPIKVGVSAGFTGPIAETVNGYAAGLLLPIKKINGEKGVLGRRVEIVQLDDKYQADLAVSNTQTFLEQGVEVLLGYVGTGPTEKTQAFLESRELMLFGPFAGATHLRTTNSANTIFVTGDYRSEIDRLVRHYTSIGSNRF